MSRIFVTGMGVISAIGNSVEENHRLLAAGHCGIAPMELIDSKYKGTLPCGEIKINNEALSQLLNATEKGVTRTSMLALHAFEQAIKQANLSQQIIGNKSTALISSTTVGGMCLTDELFNDGQSTSGGSEYLASYECSSVAMYLQKRYGMQGLINTINTACSSSANAIMYGARLIKAGRAQRAIVGGVDCLAKFTINGFNALHILSPETCTPFDANRKGLNLGEGAAFLVLEKEEDLDGKKVYAELTGYCNSNDAYHPSSLSDNGDGPFLAMKGALASAGLQTADIGFVNAHGTGTENNDEVESKAMLRLFETPPPFASTKSNTGHTLGASGAIEAVYSILNLLHQEIYPSLNFKNVIPSTDLKPVEAYTKMPLQHVMSNSFGFGGNCSSLIFSKV
ncbi:MAG: beta-ketoacyl-[acyl-carrier-protein] synthase family protein [Ferruginibacter sp.]